MPFHATVQERVTEMTMDGGPVVSTIVIIVAVILLIFYVVQAISMLRSSLNRTQKGIWTILFLTFSILTAFVWFFSKPKKVKRRRRRRR